MIRQGDQGATAVSPTDPVTLRLLEQKGIPAVAVGYTSSARPSSRRSGTGKDPSRRVGRIARIHQPICRPIIHGRTNNLTAIDAQVSVSLVVDRIAMIDHHGRDTCSVIGFRGIRSSPTVTGTAIAARRCLSTGFTAPETIGSTRGAKIRVGDRSLGRLRTTRYPEYGADKLEK